MQGTIPWYVSVWNNWLGTFLTWPQGTVVAIINAAIAISLVGFALYGIFRLLDQMGTSHIMGVGRVMEKNSRESSNGTQLFVRVGFDWLDTSKLFRVGYFTYSQVKTDGLVDITFQKGRFSGKVYMHSFDPA